MLPCELLLAGKFELTEFDPVVTRKISVLHRKIAFGTRLNLLDNWENYEYLPDTV